MATKISGLSSAAMMLAAAILATAGAGCGSAALNQDGQKANSASITPIRQWRITGALAGMGKTIDGNTVTAAVSDKAGDTYFTIDLGRACLFNMIIIRHGADRDAFPKQVAMLSSLDGAQFTLQHVALGTRSRTTLCAIKPILARYVRLRVTGDGERPWSIAEMYIQ